MATYEFCPVTKSGRRCRNFVYTRVNGITEEWAHEIVRRDTLTLRKLNVQFDHIKMVKIKN